MIAASYVVLLFRRWCSSVQVSRALPKTFSHRRRRRRVVVSVTRVSHNLVRPSTAARSRPSFVFSSTAVRGRIFTSRRRRVYTCERGFFFTLSSNQSVVTFPRAFRPQRPTCTDHVLMSSPPSTRERCPLSLIIRLKRFSPNIRYGFVTPSRRNT